jgi:hypothetical protein
MADQTNAEVSDERLRELLPCPFCGGKAYLRQWSDAARVECTSHGPRSNDCGFTMRTYLNGAEAIAAWNRRSVTSQASEGEVETAFIKLCEALGIPATAAAYLEVASPSKRVERLETALKPFADAAASLDIYRRRERDHLGRRWAT